MRVTDSPPAVTFDLGISCSRRRVRLRCTFWADSRLLSWVWCRPSARVSKDGPVMFRDVEVDGRRCDVRVRDGRVVGLRSRVDAADATEIDGGGGALIAGLSQLDRGAGTGSGRTRPGRGGTRRGGVPTGRL